ncbi:hypothetical protein AGMMS49579_00980 [Spirochaetia bacterium]|nr:hypothetical protein AGMMS49579_00980 [Spirochaetia bacterium]
MTLYNLSIRAIQDHVNNNLLDLKEIVKLLPIRLVKDLILTFHNNCILLVNKTFEDSFYDKIYSNFSKEEWFNFCRYYFLPENFIIKWIKYINLNLIRQNYKYYPFHFSKKFYKKFPFFKKMIICIGCYKKIKIINIKFSYKIGSDIFFCKDCIYKGEEYIYQRSEDNWLQHIFCKIQNDKLSYNK